TEVISPVICACTATVDAAMTVPMPEIVIGIDFSTAVATVTGTGAPAAPPPPRPPPGGGVFSTAWPPEQAQAAAAIITAASGLKDRKDHTERTANVLSRRRYSKRSASIGSSAAAFLAG